MRHDGVLAAWFIVGFATGAAQSLGTESQVPTAPSGISGVSAAQPGSPAAEQPARPGGSSAIRQREGAKITDQVGDFQKSVDRVNFFPKDGQGALRVLENLALERVVRTLDDNPTVRTWCISGVITEFRGENYLLITRAVLKARSRPGVSSERLPAETAAESATKP